MRIIATPFAALKKAAGAAALGIKTVLTAKVCWGEAATAVHTGPCIVIFPFRQTLLGCGLAGIVAYRHPGQPEDPLEALNTLEEAAREIGTHGCDDCRSQGLPLGHSFLGGPAVVEKAFAAARTLKGNEAFCHLFGANVDHQRLRQLVSVLATTVSEEGAAFEQQAGSLEADTIEAAAQTLETLKDISWALEKELLDNIDRVRELTGDDAGTAARGSLIVYKQVNSVLNSIDRLEVRGRDSAGISVLFTLTDKAVDTLREVLSQQEHEAELASRESRAVLKNNCISIHPAGGEGGLTTVSFIYKVAAEIGSLGDNIRFIRRAIREDYIFRIVSALPRAGCTISSHTRWASVGAITEANCHPVDSRSLAGESELLHVCLNGDIDNYRELKAELAAQGHEIHEEITSDTKIIPLLIARYQRQGHSVAEAFRMAVSRFSGSHAITLHTSLAPGKLFLAQKGSGQAIFVGIGREHYMPASEVYGFIEETSRYLKMNGEVVVEGVDGPTQGQIFILDQESSGGTDGITAMYYDGTPLPVTEDSISSTPITTRDIDRQGFPHYFLKEISESPLSVEKTMLNRWRVSPQEGNRHVVELGAATIPARLEKAIAENRLRRIYFIGQGTAGVAALACANILTSYLADPSVQVNACKASELSGFSLNGTASQNEMADALVVAISQSGTTADTNRTVDMVRERGAHTIAIVNRRDSDITFKVDGVLYTSSGRDIEMSVASTKAFYSQIVAGALLSLAITGLRSRRSAEFISEETRRLLRLPDQMRKVLTLSPAIEKSARRLACSRTYWAAVGSGPNKASADEIRIKLSELCYKTISSDYVEDKKHIDLSSEPLIIVCAAGSRGTVIGDIVKDTAIFNAHKAVPVVIADEGEDRFDGYAADVFKVPATASHLAPVLNTLVGHIWGYYAALAINEGSRFLYNFTSDLRTTLEKSAAEGMDVYEVILEKSFRARVVAFYNEFRKNKSNPEQPLSISMASDLILLLKYLAGKLPVSDFEFDFDKKGTALNMLDTLFERLGDSINRMSRPVDAIKHQAKTVTVGTSRISEKVEGILFDALSSEGFPVAQLLNRNVMVMKNLQPIVHRIQGSILYRIGGLDTLGEPVEDSTIEVLKKRGILADIPSRVESDHRLKGTKKIIIARSNVYIGKGRKDGRSILVIPILSTNPAMPNHIEHLLLLNIAIHQEIPLDVKIRALGGKYDHIASLVQESSVTWKKEMLNRVPNEDLFGMSAEKIAEAIVSNGTECGC